MIAIKNTPLKAQKPSRQEAEIAEVFTPPPASTPKPAPAHMPKELPKTASPFPLIGLIGLLSLGAGVSLRLATAKMN